MKARVTIVNCENCDGEIDAHEAVKYEGFLVCAGCVECDAAELQARRQLEDQRVRDMLGG